MTLAVLVFVCTLLAVAFGWYAREWTLRRRPTVEQRMGGKRCGVCLCELPKTALRTAGGHWRCAAHKGA